MLKKTIKRVKGWSLPTKLGLILGIIAILFYPFFDGHSIYNYLEGADYKIETIFPPMNNLIQVNYINDGGLSLDNIEIRYSFGLDKEIFSEVNNPIMTADIKTKNLENRGDKDSFYINMTTNPTCNLAKEFPKASLYWSDDLICYYKFEVSLPDNVCVPAEIKVILFSEEFIEGKEITTFYPVSYPVFKIRITQPAGVFSTCYPGIPCKENEAQECKPYKSAENKESLHYGGTSTLKSMEEIIFNNLKLSKKYCKEGLMTGDWCVKNNLN